MKKLLMFLCCAFVMNGTWAVENCLPVSVGVGSRFYEGAYTSEQLILPSPDDKNMLVCDRDLSGAGAGRECPNGAWVFMAGANGQSSYDLERWGGVYYCGSGGLFDGNNKWHGATGFVKQCDISDYDIGNIRNKVIIIENGDNEGEWFMLSKSQWSRVDGTRTAYRSSGNLLPRNKTKLKDVCKISSELQSCVKKIKNGENYRIVQSGSSFECEDLSKPQGNGNGTQGGCGTGAYNSDCVIPGYDGQTCATIGAELTKQSCTPATKNNSPLTSFDHKKTGDNCVIRCEPNGWNVTLMDTACENGYNPDDNAKQCVKGAPSAAERLQSCLNSRTTAEGRACCYLPSRTAKFENGKCVCSGSKAFAIGPDGRGQCNANNVVVSQPGDQPANFVCPSIDSTWLTTYKDCPDVTSAITKLQMDCVTKNVSDQYTFELRYADIQNKIAACQQASASVLVTIRKTHGDMANKIANWDKNLSVWKTAEGNFNGARLASDSIAGVVLGTAGGLITSHVVKKNQVKSGFENINCVIGGQKVADWHDEFTVGIK